MEVNATAGESMLPDPLSGEQSEFSFVPAEAAELGLDGPFPLVSRVDGTLSALRWGTAPVRAIWLHGAGLNAHTFDATILASGLPSLAIDLPGHGDSPWRDDLDYSPGAIAPDVATTVAAAAPTGAVLIGQSLGGLTAIAVAASHPQLATALVVIDISPGLQPADAAQVRDFLAGPDSFGSRAEIVDRALAFGFAAPRQALERGVFLNTRIRDDGRVVFKHHFAHLGGQQALPSNFAELWPAAEGLAVPVLLVRAEQGYLSDAQESEFLRRVPGSSVVRIDSGHNVQEQAPAALAAAVLHFLTEAARKADPPQDDEGAAPPRNAGQ